MVGDLLGLASVTPPVSFERTTLVVRPRLVALDGLFCDAGVVGGDGRRLLLRRAAGFDFHSVREYEQGESLRRVHWPTSARRGQLMVKELEDTSHDGVVVLLDCDPAGDVGTAPDSSFDAAVRIAGSILQAHALARSGGDARVDGKGGRARSRALGARRARRSRHGPWRPRRRRSLRPRASSGRHYVESGRQAS